MWPRGGVSGGFGTEIAGIRVASASFPETQEGHAMSIYDLSGYEDAVIHSSDDYEPYGYLPEARLQSIETAQGADDTRDRVIEAQLLAHWTMVGC